MISAVRDMHGVEDWNGKVVHRTWAVDYFRLENPV